MSSAHVIGGRLDGMMVPYTGPVMVIGEDQYMLKQGGGELFYVLTGLVGSLGDPPREPSS